jgi:concanavalin A-like lectin/glucanase superfamily protein
MRRLLLTVALILALMPRPEASYKFRTTTSDYIALSTNALATTGTLCWWWKSASWGNVSMWAFGIKQDGTHGFYAQHDSSGGNDMGWYNGTDGRVLTTTDPTDAAWTSMCLTYSPTSTKLYKNGSQIGSTVTNDGTFNSAGSGKYIGNENGSSVHGQDHFIAEVGLWTAILDGATLTKLANGEPPSCFSTNAVSYWALSANANDSVGSDNGTASGAASDADHPTMISCTGGGGGVTPRGMLLGVGP